jgi:aldose 1-epimerase
LDPYRVNLPYFGCIVGRYANRISNARFVLDGREYLLAKNEGENCLHGGRKGFNQVLWKAEMVTEVSEVGVKFRYLSGDGEEGFPGNLEVVVAYVLTNDNAFRIDYTAVTDEPTVVNLTHHGYWNLAGESSGGILGHELLLNAEAFLTVDERMIPDGSMRPVAGTPMDFRRPVAIGARIGEDFAQLKHAGGYDHTWVLERVGEGHPSPAAVVSEPASGRTMEVFTTEPGIHFYSGNFLDGSITGKTGRPYERQNGFCLETQHFPDSPNREDFPSVILRPGATYRSTTIHVFSWK